MGFSPLSIYLINPIFVSLSKDAFCQVWLKYDSGSGEDDFLWNRQRNFAIS